MNKLLFSLFFAPTFALSGAIFFVTSADAIEDTGAELVVLSNTEMAASLGGYGQWRSEQTRSASGSFANCAARPCQTWTVTRTYGHYRCAPCEGTESTWTRTHTTKVEKSWCFATSEVCRYRYSSQSYQWSCIAYTGSCGDHSW